jgi:hypothetical protein
LVWMAQPGNVGSDTVIRTSIRSPSAE